MKISVIIPVFNIENFVTRCLNSVISQTYDNWEAIVIDDGSTDGSGKICDDFALKDNRIKVFHLKNGGLAHARNVALDKSTGNYLFYLDGDDYIESDTFEKMIALTDGKDIVYCDYYTAYDNGDIVYNKLVKFDIKTKKEYVTAMPTATCKLIDKAFFVKSKIKFLEGKKFEDNAVIPLLSALTKNVAYLHEAKYYYYQRTGSILNQTKYNYGWEDIFDALEYMKNDFIQRGLFDEYYEEIEYIFIEYLLHAANLRFFDYKEGRSNIKKVRDVMKASFPKWSKNIYLKQESWKYKVMCKLFYGNHLFLISLIRRKK